MESSKFQKIRTSIGYPDVSPWLGGWENVSSEYDSVEYTAESVKRNVIDWENPDLDLVWNRAKSLSIAGSLLVRDATTGRPLNPNGPTGISGYGKLWTYGPSLSADGIVVHQGEVLLIERGDTGQLAYPGGYRNFFADTAEYEDSIAAAIREVKEETGIMAVGETKVMDRCIPPIVVRNTDNAWIEDAAVLIDVSDTPKDLLVPVAADDARPHSAQWVPISKVDVSKMSPRHASHLARIRGSTNIKQGEWPESPFSLQFNLG